MKPSIAIAFRAVLLTALLLFSVTRLAHGAEPKASTGTASWEDTYARLLATYVKPSGVDYASWHANKADIQALTEVVEAIGAVDVDALSHDDKLAFLINAYNAWMLHLVFEVYPVESVTKIHPDFGVFSKDLIVIDGQKSSLDKVEKGMILKELKEPRAHFGVNCASVGCPPLQAEPFRGETIDAQLDAASQAFVRSPEGVRVERGKVSLSKIFEWYAADFGGQSGVISFVNQYRERAVPRTAQVQHHAYDWALNQSR
ncbi:MAG: DUF547 domain-containing protein [Opitutales bacterium]